MFKGKPPEGVTGGSSWELTPAGAGMFRERCLRPRPGQLPMRPYGPQATGAEQGHQCHLVFAAEGAWPPKPSGGVT